MDEIRPPITPVNAPAKGRATARPQRKEKAPFLPKESHPHNWLAHHRMKAETGKNE
jgi:hypothetical protein